MIGSGDRHGLGLLLALVQDEQFDVRAGPAGEDLDGLVRAQSLGRLAIDLQDQVAGQDARLVGRRADHGGDHLEPVPLGVHPDTDPDPAESSFDLAAGTTSTPTC